MDQEKSADEEELISGELLDDSLDFEEEGLEKLPI